MQNNAPKIIIFFGKPGAGKGTQSKFVEQIFDIVQLSTGDMLRAKARDNDPLGLEVKAVMDAGGYAPDDMMLRMIDERIAQPDCANGFILDGFPRTVPQAIALDEMLRNKNLMLTAVIELVVDDELLVDRVDGRTNCAGCNASYHRKYKPLLDGNSCDICHSTQFMRRPEDNPEDLKKRLVQHKNKTAPLTDYYAETGLLTQIDGSASPDIVSQAVLRVLQS